MFQVLTFKGAFFYFIHEEPEGDIPKMLLAYFDDICSVRQICEVFGARLVLLQLSHYLGYFHR